MKLVAEFLLWCLAVQAAWIATLSSLSAPELLVGAACAVCGGLAAVGTRRAVGGPGAAAASWLRWIPWVLTAIAVDTVRLVAATPAVRAGADDQRLHRLPVPPDEPSARARARRGLGTLALSAAPGSYLVDWPPGAAPVAHSVLPAHRRLQREVCR